MSRRNFIASIFGKKGSGKSYLLNRYLSAFPRVLTLDNLGERAEEFPEAVLTYNTEATLQALKDVAEFPTWHIVASLTPEEFAPVASVIAPPKIMPDNPGYSRAVGGLCIECGEIDTYAPSGRTPPSVRNLWQRGRHYQISILAASQRTHLVDRIVTSQSDAVIAFRQHEARDIDYLADTVSEPFAEYVRRLQPYWHLRYLTDSGLSEMISPEGKVEARIDSEGNRM